MKTSHLGKYVPTYIIIHAYFYRFFKAKLHNSTEKLFLVQLGLRKTTKIRSLFTYIYLKLAFPIHRHIL